MSYVSGTHIQFSVHEFLLLHFVFGFLDFVV